MKKLFLVLLVLLFVQSASTQWVQVPSGTYENLNDIQFVDANTGFVVGNAGVVLKTTNGGNNWTIINTGSSNNNICMYFLNPNTGYVSNENYNLLYTLNGGVNWITMNTYGSNNFTSVFFINQSNGFATSNNNYSVLYKTSNGGNNWSNYGYAFCKSIKFLNSTFGYCINVYWDPGGYGYDNILTTSTSGSSWNSNTVFYYVYPAAHLNSVDFISTTIGYTVGDSGKIYKTNNGGNNWTSQNSNTTKNLKSIRSIDLNKAIAVGDYGTIRATSNSGTSWYTQNSTTMNNLNSLYMINSTTGYIAGDVGTILKTTNGGVSVRKIEELIPQKYGLQQNYPNPFNPTTNIRFSIPNDNYVKINIYDVNGRLIAKLVENYLTTGIYEVLFNASKLNSGVYFIRLESNKIFISKKMSLIK